MAGNLWNWREPSVMNLAGLFELRLIGENVGVDLWNFRTPDGRNIHKALDL